jgi:hypothetical protein
MLNSTLVKLNMHMNKPDQRWMIDGAVHSPVIAALMRDTWRPHRMITLLTCSWQPHRRAPRLRPAKAPWKKIIIWGLTWELAAHGDGYRWAGNSPLHKRQMKHAREESSNNGTAIKDCWACEKLRHHCGNKWGPSRNNPCQNLSRHANNFKRKQKHLYGI